MQKKVSRKDFRIRLEDMIQSLREEIISGKLAIGSFLPAESDLEVRYQLSNTSVRKGLETLVAEGLIEKLPRVGNRVVKPAEKKLTTITFGYHQSIGEQTDIARYIDLFHQLYPHIEVQAIELPIHGYSEAMIKYMEAGLMDIVLFNNNAFQDFAETDSLGLLEPLAVDEEIYPFLTAPFRQSEQQTLAQPFVYSPVVLCYNRSHLRERHVPEPDSSWSWEDMIRYGHQLATPNERLGFYFHLLSLNRWPVFLLQSGFVLETKPGGTYTYDHAKLNEALQLCREVLSAASEAFPLLLSESDADAEALFIEEKVSVIMTTYFFLNELRNEPIAFNVAPLPSSGLAKTLLIIVGLAINSKSRAKDAARLFVQFLTSYETQLSIGQQTLNIPANRRIAEWDGEEAVARPSRFFMHREIIPTYQLLQELGFRNKDLKDIQREIKLFLSSLQDEQMLARRLDQLLNAQKQPQ